MSIKEIKRLIARGKLKKALDETLELTEQVGDNDLNSQVILLLSRFNGNERGQRMGTIGSEAYNRTRNQITYALQALLDDLGEDYPALKEEKKQDKANDNPQGSGNINITGDGNTIITGVSGDNVHVGDNTTNTSNVSSDGRNEDKPTPSKHSPEAEKTPKKEINYPQKVFISYSHADKAYKDKLEAAFAVQVKTGKVTLWSDQDIPPGATWEKELMDNLNEADIIILLLSADFFASDYIWEVELPIIQQRYEDGSAKVFPILIRPCDWKSTPISKIQVVPTHPVTGKLTPISSWDNEDEALKIVTDKIRELL